MIDRRVQHADLNSETVIDHAANGDNTIVAGVTGKRIRVWKLWFVCGADVNVTPKVGSTALSGAVPMKANGSFLLDFDGTEWFTGALGEGFILNLSSAVQVSGRLYYTQTP